jgi:hypothetical protein
MSVTRMSVYRINTKLLLITDAYGAKGNCLNINPLIHTLRRKQL